MASSQEPDGQGSLAQQLDRCMKLYAEVKDSTAAAGDEGLQETVRAAIAGLEEVTRGVSAAGLFSRNEAADEVSTGALRFLLLPALLGELTCKLAHPDRLQVISIAEVYYRDFLQRCRDYGLTEQEIPPDRHEQAAAEPARQPRPPTMRDLATMSKQREERLRRYREQKELDRQLAALQEAMDRPSPDEETVRTFHLTLLKQAIGRAVAELNSLQLEKPILEHMQQLKSRGGPPAEEERAAPPPPPLRPVVITRTKLEAAVFGAGYSSLPTMSVEEFYEQRVRDGLMPGPGQRPGQLPPPAAGDQQMDGEARAQLEEERLERDDPAALAKARQWDDYKDDHRRGEGNRYNRS